MSASPSPLGADASPASSELREPTARDAPAGDLVAIRALLAQTPDERFLGLVRAAGFFAAAERV